LALTLAGFIDVKIKAQTPQNEDDLQNVLVSFNGIGEMMKPNLIILEVNARKPDWTIGSSQTLNKSAAKLNNKPTNTTNNIWALPGDDIDQDELEDEDNLLDEKDKVKPIINKDDCEIGKDASKKACKNCTCGRKEGISEVATPAYKSSCGNCYLGDAFRCGGCPYLGTPAFKPGEKVELNVDGIDV